MISFKSTVRGSEAWTITTTTTTDHDSCLLVFEVKMSRRNFGPLRVNQNHNMEIQP